MKVWRVTGRLKREGGSDDTSQSYRAIIEGPQVETAFDVVQKVEVDFLLEENEKLRERIKKLELYNWGLI